MKLTRTIVALLAVVSGSVSALAGDVATASSGEWYAARNCAWCHGSSSQGFSTAPRLAGQRRQYIENQLQNFKYHARDNPLSKLYMWGAAGPVSADAARELAAYLSALDAVPSKDGDERLAASGQDIYQEGIPDLNIVSCVACHGPNGEGIRGIPRLGGLSYPYLRRRLEQWGEGYHATATPPMPGIARKLSTNEIEALSSYLSFVK